MKRPLVVVGAGGLGRPTIDVVEAVNAACGMTRHDLLGVVDDGPSEVNLKRLARRQIACLGTVDEWLARGQDADYVLGIGAPSVRAQLGRRFADAGYRAATLVHPRATVGSMVSIAEGSVICAGVIMTTNISLGRHVCLNLNVTVGHDSSIEDHVVVNPAAAISGDCRIGQGALIGTGAVVLQGLTVGESSIVGASACVVRDVPPGTVVKGVPAR
ncbi:acetyltransferase [Nonomuraea sp. H19]|uniref:acetyltransferase n=1 Tax=Nonomuraea sp. H19 TaxID=3452206 RepID=UPI003F8A8404